MDYDTFLRAKVTIAKPKGFEVDQADVNPLLKPHQIAAVIWAIRLGCAALFMAFGLGKTFVQLEIVRIVRARIGGMGLIVIPLGVRQEFIRDAARLGITVKFIRRIEEADDPNGIYLTNYETIRDRKLDPLLFSVASLDEAACLRGFGGSKTFREFMALFAGDDRRDMANRVKSAGVPYRFVATATPSPNEFVELLAYSAFLGVMDVGQAKTRFFKRNSEKADNLTLSPARERDFWLWVASWALFVQKPSDLGYSDDGYELPPIDIRWHEIPADHADAGTIMDGQAMLEGLRQRRHARHLQHLPLRQRLAELGCEGLRHGGQRGRRLRRVRQLGPGQREAPPRRLAAGQTHGALPAGLRRPLLDLGLAGEQGRRLRLRRAHLAPVQRRLAGRQQGQH